MEFHVSHRALREAPDSARLSEAGCVSGLRECEHARRATPNLQIPVLRRCRVKLAETHDCPDSYSYAVSAVVVDRAGEVIVAMRADNAGPHTMENAPRKAYTARSFRTSTTAYAKRFADNDPVVRQQVTLPNVIAIPGGLPVKLGDEVIAGVGISGSPGVDEPCVQAGLDKVAEQLK